MVILALDLPSLIFDVRAGISDIPGEYATDNQVHRALKLANAFVNKVRDQTIDEDDDFLKNCVIVLAIYYAYLGYTSLAERQLGTLPPTAAVRVKALRELAASFLQLISVVPLTEDLLIDSSSYRDTPGIAFGITNSVLTE